MTQKHLHLVVVKVRCLQLYTLHTRVLSILNLIECKSLPCNKYATNIHMLRKKFNQLEFVQFEFKHPLHKKILLPRPYRSTHCLPFFRTVALQKRRIHMRHFILTEQKDGLVFCSAKWEQSCSSILFKLHVR